MQVKIINHQQWWRFLHKCPAATFFHTPDWYEVWKNYAHYNYEARLISLESGRNVLLPISWRRRLYGLAKEYMSSPAGTYGSILSCERLIIKEIKIIQQYLHSFSWMQLRENPFHPLLDADFFTNYDFTQVIDLQQEMSGIIKGWTKGHLSAAKKGMRERLKVDVAHFNQWKDYFDIYLHTYSRWENPPESEYTWELFENLRKLPGNKCRLWLAFYENKIIAGALCFYFQKHVVYWHGASLKKYFHLRPVHVLQYHIIQHAIHNKFYWYDFNPSGGHEGVVNFKKGFGTTKLTAAIYSNQSIILKKLIAFKNKTNF